MYKYIVETRAQQEYEAALEWYAARSEQATRGFVKSIETTLENIRITPNSGKIKYKMFREINISKYPFTIIYTIEAAIETIVVISIFHQKRDPDKKYD